MQGLGGVPMPMTPAKDQRSFPPLPKKETYLKDHYAHKCYLIPKMWHHWGQRWAPVATRPLSSGTDTLHWASHHPCQPSFCSSSSSLNGWHVTYIAHILFQCYRPWLTSLILTMRLTKAAQIFVPIQHYRDDVVCLCYSTATTPVALSTVTGGSRCLGWLSSWCMITTIQRA